MLTILGLALTGYLLGSLSCAVLVCRAMGLPDPRAGGSGNPGATNVLRLGGKWAAALTLAGDVLKGVVPVVVAKLVSDAPLDWAAAALGAFVGHLFPVFFAFRGGKGVATALGAVTTLAWPVGLGMIALWLGVALVTRYSSLASLCAGIGSPALAAWLAPAPPIVGCLVLMCALLVWRHRDNIRRLANGTESRIGQKRPAV
jgi:glycerol-3-phosphate acyltransferase PlsY